MNLSTFHRFFLVLAGILVLGLVDVQPTLAQTDEDDVSEMDGMEDEGDMMDEGYEEMMDEGYSEGGGGPRRSNRSGSFLGAIAYSGQDQMGNTFKNLDLSIFTAPPGTYAPVESGPVLATEAEHAYKNGNYPLALELFFAHMAVEYEEANSSLNSVKLSQLLKKPVWQIRFAVSYTVRGAIDAEPNPIQEGAKSASPAGRGRGRGNGGQGERGGFDDLGSDQGGGFDEGMMDDMGGEDMGMEDQGGDPRERQRGSRERPVAPTREMLSSQANEAMNRYLGLVATVVAEQFDSRYRSGDFGAALTSVAAPAPADPQPGFQRGGGGAEDTTLTSFSHMSQEIQDTLADSAEPIPLWKAGIQYLGEMESADISAKAARQHGIDFVLHFDIFLKESRDGNVQNVSRCRLMSVAAAKSMGVSKGIDSYEAVSQARAGRMDHREYVKEQLSALLGIIDRQIKTVALPTLSPEIAKRRIASMLASNNANSLRSLAEIRLYQRQGSITAEEAETAFDIVGGEDALLMMHGPAEQKLEVAREWALRAVPESE